MNTVPARGSAHNGGPDGGFKQQNDQMKGIRDQQITIWTFLEGRTPG